MSLSPAVIDAMVANGATVEMLAAVIKAELAAEKTRRGAPRAGAGKGGCFDGRRPYQRAPRTKASGPASNPRTYQSEAKSRALAYAEGFTLGAAVPRLPEREWWPLVGRVQHRDSFTCTYCGADGETYILHCDHIVPVSRGGPNEIENLTTACEYCNSAKCDRLPQEWLA